MTPRIVLDTNVVVSSALKARSFPGRVVDAVFDGRCGLVLCDDVLAEYREVLLRPKFGLSSRAVNDFVDGLAALGEYLDVAHVPDGTLLPDPKDVVFYELLLGASRLGDAWLVTGNGKHFPQRENILSPHEFCELFGL